MTETTVKISNSGKPAPRWFRKFKKIFSNTENFILGLLLIMGHSSDAPLLLIIKLSSSFILENLETLIANGESYQKNENNGQLS